MAKLKKPRKSSNASAAVDPEVSSSPVRPSSFTSTRSHSRSISNSSTTALSAPIALRTAATRKSSAAPAAPTFDAAGEFTALTRSSSSSYSLDALARSPRSSRLSTSFDPPTAATFSSPVVARSPSSTASISVGSSSVPSTSLAEQSDLPSVLATLRHKLDSDQVAREQHQSDPPPRKLTKRRQSKSTTIEDDTRPTSTEELPPAPLETSPPPKVEEEMVEVDTIVLQVVEEQIQVVAEENVSPPSPRVQASQAEAPLPPEPVPPTAVPPRPRPPSTHLEDSADVATTTGSSIVFAPARLGWRLASGTVHLGLDASKSVVKRVPIVGKRLVPEPAYSQEPKAERTNQETIRTVPSLPSPLPSNGSDLSFATSTKRSDKSTLEPDPLAAETLFEERAEHGIVYKAAELSLGLGIASVLLGGALGKMAWRRVVHGPTTEGR
ncbi:uncharacterized protein JCM15063_002944 [Sporobolomyces koalae]|uniref:uncharacterized protein n=1 Tax=Sporobolomyces koalae TaxID=500713 RepID=UPI00316B6EFC